MEVKPVQDNESQNDVHHKCSIAVHPEVSDAAEKQKDKLSLRPENLEEMYAVVHKKPKKYNEQEETAPPVPSYTIEALYTAVQKRK